MSSSSGLVPSTTSSGTPSATALETSPVLGLVSPRGTQNSLEASSQSPHHVLRRVSLQQLRYESLGSSSALQFHIGAAGSSNPPVTPQTQSTRVDDQQGQRQRHDRHRQQHFTVPTPAPMLTPLPPFVERDSDSEESDDSTTPRRTAAPTRYSRRPPIARRRTPVVHSPTPVPHPSTPATRPSTLQAAVAAHDSEEDLPNLLDVSDSSDLGSADDRDGDDSASEDDDDWTDDESEEPATVSGAYMTGPGSIPTLAADRRGTLFPPFAPATPNAMPLDIWQALVGSIPTERPPDPERAKELMRGLEPVPEDLLDRWFAAAGDSADAICAICREDLNEIDETLQSDSSGLARLLALSCRHVFHSECLGPWLARRTTCPTCRFDLDPDSLTLRAPPAGAEAAATSERIAQLLAPLARPIADVGGPTTVDYAERLRQLFGEPFLPTPAEGEGTPVDSPLDVLAWQEALNQFVILGGNIEDRLRTYAAAIDAETRTEMEEERDVYRQTENLVQRGLAEARRMAESGEADEVLAYIERGGGGEDSEAEDESWDEGSGDEMPPLERITPAGPPTQNDNDDDDLPPPLEPITNATSPTTLFTVTQPPAPQVPPPPTNFWRSWRREARVLFQALYDIGSQDTEEARGILGDLDERARVVAHAITMPLPTLPPPPPPPAVEDDTSLLVRVLRGEAVGARERDSARRTDTRLFMQGLGAAAWGIVQVGPAELAVVEQVYESRRDALNVLTGHASWASPVSEDRELAIFIRSLHDALSPNAPDRISIIEAARTAYLDRRRLHRNLIPPTPAIPTVAISPPTLLWPGLPDIPLAADNLLRQLVGPMLTATAATTPSSPAATLNIASPPLPSLVVPPGPTLGSGASAAERRTWARPEGQTLLEWVEEREQVHTDVE